MTAVTYIRPGDRTRVVFVFETDNIELAEQRAREFAPADFQWAARCQPGERLRVPADGDDYGTEAPSIPASWLKPA